MKDDELFFDRYGDLIILGKESGSGSVVVLCLASDRNYIESSDGYFVLQFPPSTAQQYVYDCIRPVAREELPLYINKKYKAKKFVELFK